MIQRVFKNFKFIFKGESNSYLRYLQPYSGHAKGYCLGGARFSVLIILPKIKVLAQIRKVFVATNLLGQAV